MKISVTSYSFAAVAKEYNQLALVKLVKEMGFDGLELTELTPPDGISQLEYAVQIREEAKKYGIPLVSYTVGANLLKEDTEAEIARLKGQVDIAAELGVPVMRHDAYFAFPENGPKDFDFYLDKVACAFRRVTEYAAEKGIRTCTENHGLICQDSERVERIIKAVNNPNFGWLVDMGNFLCVDESPIEAVTRGAKYAFHVHMKDFYRAAADQGGFKTRGGNMLIGSILGKGIVPVKDCVEIIRKSGYNGYFSLEFEGKEPCLDAVRSGLAFARSLGD